jgi:hypothetical protein
MLTGSPATDSRACEHPKGAPQCLYLDQMLGYETSLLPDSPRISSVNSFSLDATSLALRRSGTCREATMDSTNLLSPNSRGPAA